LILQTNGNRRNRTLVWTLGWCPIELRETREIIGLSPFQSWYACSIGWKSGNV